MARWEPNARERLLRAALDLFAEQGYEATTVNEIADRAGLTKTTFFRHFPDKREVLFVGQEVHNRLVTEGIAAAPASATPLEAVAAALDDLAGSFAPPERREIALQVRELLAANAELRERAQFKRASLAEAMARALRERGVPELPADLAGDLGSRAFHRAFDEWTGAAAEPTPTLAELARRALEELRAAAAALQ